jgi:hypothetical protein
MKVRSAVRTRGKVIVFGILFYYPLAGVTYQFLHYLLALRRLGYDPYYVEDSGRWVYDPELADFSPDATRNIAKILPQLAAHGFAERWCFRGCYAGGGCHGLDPSGLAALYREADVFLNVTGAQELREEHLTVPRRIYVESDPFALQVRLAEGDASALEQIRRHDAWFSFGENLGAADCTVPPTPFSFLPTRQPVALELWSDARPVGAVYNTISTWQNRGKDIQYRGDTYYWTKDREFCRWIDLPVRCSVPFELATDVSGEARALLERHRWRLSSSLAVSQDAARYRSYILSSRGEFTVARDQYVRPRTGWFSDRSACYLAAGRPVITQDTGFGKFLPTGKGLFAFGSLEEVLTAVDAIESDPEGHGRAAREIAAEYFAAERVVGSLMERAGC